jgi:uncharacterized protein (TIGR03435 family)
MRFLPGIVGMISIAFAQTRFEVASVKAAPESSAPVSMSCKGGPGTQSPGRVTCSHAALVQLILAAYDLTYDRVIYPDWVGIGGTAGGYDVAATIPKGTTKEQYREMLRNLLRERFHLEVHREMRDASVYSLGIGKGRLRLTEATAGQTGSPSTWEMRDGHIHIVATHATMANLANSLSVLTVSAVQDKTGLTGQYRFELDFAPDPQWMAKVNYPPQGDITREVQTLSSAVAELGLKLDRSKAPVEYLIVDRAEKVPTEN